MCRVITGSASHNPPLALSAVSKVTQTHWPQAGPNYNLPSSACSLLYPYICTHLASQTSSSILTWQKQGTWGFVTDLWHRRLNAGSFSLPSICQLNSIHLNLSDPSDLMWPRPGWAVWPVLICRDCSWLNCDLRTQGSGPNVWELSDTICPTSKRAAFIFSWQL